MPKWNVYLDELDDDNEQITEKFEKINKRTGGKLSELTDQESAELKKKERRVDKLKRNIEPPLDI